MRADFRYIDGVTAIGLTTTDKGSELIKGLSTEELESQPGGINELLMLAENCYIFISYKGGIDEWLKAIYAAATSEYGSTDPGIMKEDLAKAFAEGYIAFRKIIWD